MGIKFTCPHCKTSLNVKSELAGKRGRCPQCQQKIEIPKEDSPSSGRVVIPAPQATTSETPAVGASAAASAPAGAATSQAASQPSPASAPSPSPTPGGSPAVGVASDPISEAPKLQWYVMPPGATSQYGPAVGEEFRNWIKEGRVTGDTLVWRQDWSEWKLAGAVFPELAAPAGGQTAAGQAPGAPVAPAGFAIPTAAGALPTASGPVPMGVPAFSGPLDVGPAWNPAGGGFPAVGAPAGPSSVRRTQYRAKSNTGPMIVIGVLVLVMIPLSYFVIKVVKDQFFNAPPAASSKKPAE